jgi:endoglucanase
VHYPGIILSQQEFEALPPDQQAAVKGNVDAEWTLEKMEAMMEKPIQKGKELGLQVYCGEYGVIDKAPIEDKIRWYTDMTTLFHKHGIASANWNYKSGSFGIVDKELNQNAAMIEAMTGK